MKDFEPGVTAPPFHVYCGSTTVPYFEENFGQIGERAARDETVKTYYVPANMKYLEWRETFIGNEGKQEKKESVVNQENHVIIKETVSDKLKEELTSQLSFLTEEEKAMIAYYTGFGAQKINSNIASGNIDKVQHEVDILDLALEKGVIPENMTVIRKTVPEYMNFFPEGYKPTMQDMLSLLEQELMNDIFTSTALEEFPYSGRNVEIHIHIPKGYKGALYVKPLASKKHKDQEEVLFRRGFRYKITNIVYENKIYYMEAEAI